MSTHVALGVRKSTQSFKPSAAASRRGGGRLSVSSQDSTGRRLSSAHSTPVPPTRRVSTVATSVSVSTSSIQRANPAGQHIAVPSPNVSTPPTPISVPAPASEPLIGPATESSVVVSTPARRASKDAAYDAHEAPEISTPPLRKDSLTDVNAHADGTESMPVEPDSSEPPPSKRERHKRRPQPLSIRTPFSPALEPSAAIPRRPSTRSQDATIPAPSESLRAESIPRRASTLPQDVPHEDTVPPAYHPHEIWMAEPTPSEPFSRRLSTRSQDAPREDTAASSYRSHRFKVAALFHSKAPWLMHQSSSKAKGVDRTTTVIQPGATSSSQHRSEMTRKRKQPSVPAEEGESDEREESDDNVSTETSQSRRRQPRPRVPREEIPEKLETLEDRQPDLEASLDTPILKFATEKFNGLVSRQFKEYTEKKRAAVSQKPATPAPEGDAAATDGTKIKPGVSKIEVPQPTIGILQEDRNAAQGKYIPGKGFILDKDSLLVQQPSGPDPSIMVTVEETDLDRLVNNATYGKKSRGSKWSMADTDRFYEALSQWGTDFESIARLFHAKTGTPRTRAQIRLKFNKEERENPQRIQEALIGKKKRVDLDHYTKSLDEEDKERFDGKEKPTLEQLMQWINEPEIPQHRYVELLAKEEVDEAKAEPVNEVQEEEPGYEVIGTID
ncbi:hypothetical protein BZG36_02884 [Bifiguratus adelaidae]|uniref:Myb-like domain-containing protein n=1 Tax=Bifiguratus adelaidae TaxID=1938954 RepID=A0A261Y2E0_9FUNG|nr:hypothetical protein BZG36_02884 [Bifiguratus adelaidae]